MTQPHPPLTGNPPRPSVFPGSRLETLAEALDDLLERTIADLAAVHVVEVVAVDHIERKKQELRDEIERDGLVGPWSWSDQLQHVATIVAYGVLRKPDQRPENVVDGILAYIRETALYIVSREDEA